MRGAVLARQRPTTAAVGRSVWKINLPPEYLLIHRVWIGGIGVLCQIEGEVPVLEVLGQWLPNFDLDELDEALAEQLGDGSAG